MKLRNRAVHRNPDPEEDSAPPQGTLSPAKQPSDVMDYPPPLKGEEYAPRGGPRPTSYRTQKREMDSSIGAVGRFRTCVRIPFLLLVLLLILLYVLHLNEFL